MSASLPEKKVVEEQRYSGSTENKIRAENPVPDTPANDKTDEVADYHGHEEGSLIDGHEKTNGISSIVNGSSGRSNGTQKNTDEISDSSEKKAKEIDAAGMTEREKIEAERKDSEPVTLLQRIGSTAFWTFLVSSCFVMFAGALTIFLCTFWFDSKRRIQHLYSCFWGHMYFLVNPIWKLRIEGRKLIPWNRAAVIVSNHQSLGDILVLFGLYRPFKWVSKASVFKVPLLGWNMRFNRYIPLVRGDRQSIENMMNMCKYWLKRNVPVLMFPEGTRSKDGNLLPFKDGAFRMAVESGCPIIPIALSGTAATLPKHGYLIRQRADCRVRVLPPVEPGDFNNSIEALRDYVKNLINNERLKLEAESRKQIIAK